MAKRRKVLIFYLIYKILIYVDTVWWTDVRHLKIDGTDTTDKSIRLVSYG
jgi:hypothetical protein